MQERQIHIQDICSTKKRVLSLSWWKWYSMISLPPGSWLIIPQTSTRLGTQCWALWLTNWILVSSCNLFCHGRWIFMWLSPYTNPSPSCSFTVHKTVRQWKECLGKEVDWCPQNGCPIYLIISIILCKGCPLMNIHVGHKYIDFFFPLGVDLCTSSPDLPVSRFPVRALQVPERLAKP